MPDPKHGDKVKIITADEEIEGVLMPSLNSNIVSIKLDNGYNIGIDSGKINEIRILEGKKVHPKKEISEMKVDEKKKIIAILHTGGTIASKVDYDLGGVIAKFSAEDMVMMFPELTEIANIRTELVSNMMSEDIEFTDYKKIAQAVKKQIDNGAEGVIIGHGTDTLAVTAAALSFMFDNLKVPVLVVGSQRSTDRGSTDGAMNLICAADFISKTEFAGVAICMHDSMNDNRCAILPATKTRKMHTSRRDAFKAINDTPIAYVDYATRKIDFVKTDHQRIGEVKGPMILKDNFNPNVGILKTHPNMKSSLFSFYAENYDAIVMEATGIGQAPTNLGDNNLKIYEILKEFIKKGGIVVLTSQCIFGRVHPFIYTNCRRLYDIGVIFCEDMLTETAFVKLAWLLGNYQKDEVKRLLIENLRGEIDKRILVGEFC